MKQRVFVYEAITSGGGYRMGLAPQGSLLAEGSAMRTAIVEDFLKLPHTEIVTLRDRRLPSFPHEAVVKCQIVSDVHAHDTGVQQFAHQSDWTIVIAPESAGLLAAISRQVDQSGGRRLGPALEDLAWMSDKWKTIQHFKDKLPFPTTYCATSLPASFGSAPPAGTWVAKPKDGVGCEGVRIVKMDSPNRRFGLLDHELLQRWCPGQPASVGLLLGSDARILLPPCWQDIHVDHAGRLNYRGGGVIRDRCLESRARKLAARLAPDLIGTGFVGVDMILGSRADGTEDVLLELNPRLTTSYVGLRTISLRNLADVMLRLAEGREVSVEFRDEPVAYHLQVNEKGSHRVVVGD